MASSDEEDQFYDAKEDISKSRANTLEYKHEVRPGNCSDEVSQKQRKDVEVDSLLREQEILKQEHAELEKRMQEEAKALQTKLQQLQRQKEGRMATKQPDAAATQSTKQKVVRLRECKRQSSSPMTSFEEDRLKGSSLERAKATLSKLDGLADPASIAEHLLSVREFEETSSAEQNYSRMESAAASPDPNQTQSTSTPLTVADKPAVRPINLVSPIPDSAPSNDFTPNRKLAADNHTSSSGFGSASPDPYWFLTSQPLTVDLSGRAVDLSGRASSTEPDIIASNKMDKPTAPPRYRKSPSPTKEPTVPRPDSLRSSTTTTTNRDSTDLSDSDTDGVHSTGTDELRAHSGFTLPRYRGSLINVSGTGEPSLTLRAATLGRSHITVEADSASLYHRCETLPLRSGRIDSRTNSLVSGQRSPSRTPLNFPLSQQLAARTQSKSDLKQHGSDSDQESIKSSKSGFSTSTQNTLKKRSQKLKKLFGRALNKVKAKHDEGVTTVPKEISASQTPVAAAYPEDDDAFTFKSMLASGFKGSPQFDGMKLVQDMSGEHSGPVWIIKFSKCGRLLATGGQDTVIRVWSLKDSQNYFDEMKIRYTDVGDGATPASSQENLLKVIEEPPPHRVCSEEESPFTNKIFISYRGHTADVLDLSWSKNNFLLSSSIDKTVRLWHVYREECLCCFQHIDFVTAICFHPNDDRYFLSGSLDGKLRLWSIPEKRVHQWNDVSGSSQLITAVNFCQQGRFAVVGTNDGRCIFYTVSEQLKYFTAIHVRSSRGKNKVGSKVTGITQLNTDKILVTTNDSRLRLYSLTDMSLVCKYKGAFNESSQIKADFSHDGQYILCGSEDSNVYFWRTDLNEFVKFPPLRKDRNHNWEAIRAHTAVVTAAVFAPKPHLFFTLKASSLNSNDTMLSMLQEKAGTDSSKSHSGKSTGNWSFRGSMNKKHPIGPGYVVVTADYSGSIKVLSKSISSADT